MSAAGRRRLEPPTRDELATRIQSVWRGHFCRCELLARAAHMQSFLGRRGTRLLARENIRDYPSLLSLPRPQPRRRRARPVAATPPVPLLPSGAALQPGIAPPPATADQRLSVLKTLHAEAWRLATAQVDDNHPDVRQRTDGRELSSQQFSKIRRAVREQHFVNGLGEDACFEAGFFGPDQHKIQICNRVFYPPRGDLMMDDAPAAKRSRST